MKIFLLEDDYILNKSITQYLNSKNFEVDTFMSGLEAFDKLSDLYDVMLLDIDIPELDGITLLTEIRKMYPQRPVIMISATSDIEMIAKAYELGCTDYVKKPFDIRELECKIKSFMQKESYVITAGSKTTYDMDTHRLFYDGEEINLTAKEQQFLSILFENKNRTISSDMLETAIWGVDGTSMNLRQLVTRLRKKITENIVTNHIGSGYCIA
jgi:two-component system, OmpR family, response regulator